MDAAEICSAKKFSNSKYLVKSCAKVVQRESVYVLFLDVWKGIILENYMTMRVIIITKRK